LKRSVLVNFWLRPSEARLLRRTAEARELTLPDWCRATCLRSARRIR